MTKTEKAIFDEIKAARDAGAHNGAKYERNFAKLRNSSWAIK